MRTSSWASSKGSGTFWKIQNVGLRVTNKRGMERMVFSDARVHVREATRSIHGSDHASLTRTLFAEQVNERCRHAELCQKSAR